jgi:hypothetical protein
MAELLSEDFGDGAVRYRSFCKPAVGGIYPLEKLRAVELRTEKSAAQ